MTQNATKKDAPVAGLDEALMSVLDGRVLFEPDAASVTSSQLTDFGLFCAAETGESFLDHADFHRFSTVRTTHAIKEINPSKSCEISGNAFVVREMTNAARPAKPTPRRTALAYELAIKRVALFPTVGTKRIMIAYWAAQAGAAASCIAEINAAFSPTTCGG